MRDNVSEQFTKLGIIPNLVPESRCFATFVDATDWLKRNLMKRGDDKISLQDEVVKTDNKLTIGEKGIYGTI